MSHVVTVPELLDGHTVLDIECLDRMYLLSELGRQSSQLTGQVRMRADTFPGHDRSRRAAGSGGLGGSAGGLAAVGRPETTLRTYSIALLRWFRFLWAAGVAWDQATRAEARDFCRWIQMTAK